MDERIRLVVGALWSEEEGEILGALTATGCIPLGVVLRGEALLCAVALFVRMRRLHGWPRGSAAAAMGWAMRNWRDGGPAALSEERKRRDRVQGRCWAPGSEVVGRVAAEVSERSKAVLEPPNAYGAAWVRDQANQLERMVREQEIKTWARKSVE